MALVDAVPAPPDNSWRINDAAQKHAMCDLSSEAKSCATTQMDAAAAAAAAAPLGRAAAAAEAFRCISPAMAQCDAETLPLGAIAPEAAASRAPSPPAAAADAAVPAADEPWVHQLVDCPYLFKPCEQCATSHSGREVLITYFDMDAPSHGYCTYCPGRTARAHLLQIRRSTYHEVIKAADINRMVDVSGIQHYVINGSKVLFLRPRPQPRPPKGVVAPARCVVDGRQLMDSTSHYCSLRCKLQSEDVAFAQRHGPVAAASGGQDGGKHDEDRAGSGSAVVKSVVAPRRPAAGKRPADANDAVGEEGQHDGATHLASGSRSNKRRTLGGADIAAAALTNDAAEPSPPPPSVAAPASSAEKAQPQSPTSSHDSGRSSTCNCRWQHRRKGEPIRSPLQ